MITVSRFSCVGLLVLISACGSKITSEKKPDAPKPQQTKAEKPKESGKPVLTLHDDADKNGVRDDVDRHLQKTYRVGTREYKAGRQVASAVQGMLSAADDRKAAQAAARTYLNALDCAEAVFAGEFRAHVDGVLEASIDTTERSKAFRKAQGHFSGSSFAIKSDEQLEAACEE